MNLTVDFTVFFIQTFNILADLLVVLIFVRVIFSWFNVRHGWIAHFVNESTDFFLNPIRRALPHTGFLDFSPIIALILIEVARSLVNQALL